MASRGINKLMRVVCFANQSLDLSHSLSYDLDAR